MTRAEAICPREITEELRNPDRGFYSIYRFQADDGTDSAQREEILRAVRLDDHSALGLLEINLRQYRRGPISCAGLNNLETLFQGLRDLGKRWIVRFLYDWDGKNMETEPERLEVILGHMRSLRTILRQNADQIFTLQGLFIGNWGEMTGTRYRSREDLCQLAKCLADAAEEKNFLSVRTPAQWRSITEAVPTLAGRLGLFNDGMFGSETDLGTYSCGETDAQGRMAREKELAFQHTLCRAVPNGGEAVGTAVYSDFEQAVETMRQIHVTYLNRDYDPATLTKWRGHTVVGGLWNGADGLTFMERHLGYRFVIKKIQLKNRFLTGKFVVFIELFNDGFAPVYQPMTAELTVTDGQRALVYPLAGDPCGLAGGESMTLRAEIDWKAWKGHDCSVFFRLRKKDSCEEIRLANEKAGENGCLIGRLYDK